MTKLEFKNDLLYTSIVLEHGNKSVIIKDVIVDTGASETLILTDYLMELDTELSGDEEIVRSSGYGGVQCSAVSKKIDRICMGNIAVDGMDIDFGEIDPNERVNGLIGLNFLRSAGVVIDLVELEVYRKSL